MVVDRALRRRLISQYYDESDRRAPAWRQGS